MTYPVDEWGWPERGDNEPWFHYYTREHQMWATIAGEAKDRRHMSQSNNIDRSTKKYFKTAEARRRYRKRDKEAYRIAQGDYTL